MEVSLKAKRSKIKALKIHNFLTQSFVRHF
jgi:hypothetical protein